MNPLILLTLVLIGRIKADVEGNAVLLWKALQSNEQYKTYQMPTRLDGSETTTHVLVNIIIHSLGGFKAITMDFEVGMFFQMNWRDPRLSNPTYKAFLPVRTNSDDLVSVLWKPDLYFKNSKTASYQDITVPNTLLTISEKGEVYLSRRITATLACEMNLRKYPMDEQSCPIYMESYMSLKQNVNITWKPDASISKTENVSLPEFQITGLEADECNGTYSNGQYSCIRGIINLRRYGGFHLYQTFITSITIVVISWLNFWIDPTAIPARITLSITTFLTLTTQASGLRSVLPQVSYVKAIDEWMITCTFFLVANLSEFVLVNALTIIEARQKTENNEEKVKLSDLSFFRTIKKATGQVKKTKLLAARKLTVMPGSHAHQQVVAMQGKQGPMQAWQADANLSGETPPLDPQPQATTEQPITVPSVEMQPSNEEATLKQINGLNDEDSTYENGPPVSSRASFLDRYHLSASSVDAGSRFLFPLAFVLFNIGFWRKYKLHLED